jgi:hypothetical protein
MGVFEYSDFRYPIDDFTLSHLRAVLDNELLELPYIDVLVYFSATDRVEFRLTAESDYEILVREWTDLCDRCLIDLVTEAQLSGMVCIVGGARSAIGDPHAG